MLSKEASRNTGTTTHESSDVVQAAGMKDGVGSGEVQYLERATIPEKIPRGFGRLIRDDSNNIVDVQLWEPEGDDPAVSGDDAGLMGSDDDFEIGHPVGQPERINIPSTSGWLLENGEGKEHATKVTRGACSKSYRKRVYSASKKTHGCGRENLRRFTLFAFDRLELNAFMLQLWKKCRGRVETD